MRWSDFTSGRVDMAQLEESKGWLGSGPEQDEMSEAIDREIGNRRLTWPTPGEDR